MLIRLKGSNFFVAWETRTRAYHNIHMYRDLSPSPTPSPVLEGKGLEDSLEDADQPSSQPTTASQDFEPPLSDAPPTIDGTTKRAGTIIFKDNFLHDLESLWWIAVYFLFYKEVYVNDIFGDENAVLRSASELGHQQALATNLFHCVRTDGPSPRHLHLEERYRALYEADYFKNQIDDLLPPTIQEVGYKMNDIRIIILQSYARINMNPARKLSLKRKAKISSSITSLFKEGYRSGGLLRSLRIRPLPDLKYKTFNSAQSSYNNTANTITQDLVTITVRKRTGYSSDAEEDPDFSRAAKRRHT